MPMKRLIAVAWLTFLTFCLLAAIAWAFVYGDRFQRELAITAAQFISCLALVASVIAAITVLADGGKK